MTVIDHKNIKLSEKVQEILYKKGYSHIFNWEEYRAYFKECKNFIFPAEAIAQMFIENCYELSDFAEYEF